MPSRRTDPYTKGLLHSFWMSMRPLIALHRRNAVLRGVTKLSELWLKAYENCDGVFSRNGEQLVLASLRDAGIDTVFDVGANLGDWLIMARREVPDASIHAFELSPPTYVALCDTVRHMPRVVTNDFGLSDEEGDVELNHYPEFPGETSLLNLPYQKASAQRLRSRVVRGDDYCARNRIERIGLLKIDVEGAESKVLRGFERMLSDQRIDVIQFEYTQVNPATRFLLKDFYALLGNSGYTIGKIFPSYIEFREYRSEHEMQWSSNFLAVSRNRVGLLDRLPT